MTKLIFGCGYLGERVARRWRDAGEEVVTVTRSAERAETLRAAGYCPLVADVTDPASLAELPVAETVLWAVGFDRTSGRRIDEVYVDGLRKVLAALPCEPRLFLYISSTGVYAQGGGAWVDEDSPCEPTRPGGRGCFAAEQLLSEHRLGRRTIVLRLAGIYGPCRVPYLDRIRRGEPIPAPDRGHLNLIHVDDAAQVVEVVARELEPPGTYCVSDGHPIRRADYYAEIARLLDSPPPRFSTPPSDSAAARRAAADKRVRNDRLLSVLDLRFRYPSYHEGLSAILGKEGSGI